jgi:hypothetical protein
MGPVAGAALLGRRPTRFEPADSVVSNAFLVMGIVAFQAAKVRLRLCDLNTAMHPLLETSFDVIVAYQALLW